MAKNKKIILGGLNIVASPHPVGVYEEMFKSVAGTEVALWGSDHARITEPRPRDGNPDQLHGLIHLWTKIDRKGRWFDRHKDGEAEEAEKSKIVLPSHLDPNYRTFNYAFIKSRHRLIFEIRNEFGDNFGVSRAERLFGFLFSRELLGSDHPSVTITPIPEDGAIDRILAIPRLAKIVIHLERPNAEDLDDEEVLADLEQQGARSQEITLIKAADADTLSLSKRNRALAEIAAENGYVSGRGKDAQGKKTDVSTKEHPKIIPVEIQENETVLTRFFASLGLF